MNRLQARVNLVPGTRPAEVRDHHVACCAIGGEGQ